MPHYSRYFTARGDDVLVISFSPDSIDGIAMEFVGIQPYSNRTKRVFITRVPQVRRIIRRFQPDMLYAPYLASNGLTAVLAWRGPIVVAARGGDVIDQAFRMPLKRWLFHARVKYVCKRAVAIHTVSQELNDELLRLGIPERKLVTIPVGTNVEKFHPAPDMPRNGVPHLICVRKHEYIYDNATIIDALAALRAAGREFRCTFAGAGNLTEELKAQAEGRGLNDCVTFLGNLPHEQLPDLLRQADIYLSASLSDGTSSSLLEGMATGLLPVVSRITANEPWIEHGRNGLLFEPGRPDLLAEALKKGMSDLALRERALAENPPLIGEAGNMHKNMDRLAELFESVVAGRFGTS